MKRIDICLLLLTAAFAFSCTEKEESDITTAPGSPVDVSYTVNFAGREFVPGDRIALLSGDTVSSLVTGGDGVFTGKAPRLNSWEHYQVVYPYDESLRLVDGEVVTVLPSALHPVPGMTEGAIGVGVTAGDDDPVTLRQTNALLQFTLTRDDITTLSIAGMAGESIVRNGALVIREKLTPGVYTIGVPADVRNGFRFSIGTEAGDNLIHDLILREAPGAGKTVQAGIVDDDGQGSGEDPAVLPLPAIDILHLTSSTVTVSWSVSGFNDIYQDITPAWSARIYSDEACSQEAGGFDFAPTVWLYYNGTPSSNHGGPYSPRFCFAGLQAETPYWVKVWYTYSPEVSAVLPIRTKASGIVLQPETAMEGNVILGEDFSALRWGGDFAMRAFGTALDGTLANPNTENGLFNTLKKQIVGTSLEDWSSISEDNSTGKTVARAGYIKLGASSVTGGIVTPPLGCLTDPAVIRVSFRAHPFYEPLESDPLGTSVLSLSTTQTGVEVVTSYTVRDQVDFSIDPYQEWRTYAKTVQVRPGDRIAISTRRISGTGQCRIFVDDIKLELVEYQPEESIMDITDAQTLQTFLDQAASIQQGEVVKILNDIDLSGVSLHGAPVFAGTLDAGGFALKNWAATEPLFGRLSGEVRNLTIDASSRFTVDESSPAAFVASDNRGTIIDCVNAAPMATAEGLGTFSASRGVAAFAAVNGGTIRSCTNLGTITLSPETVTTASSIIDGTYEYGAAQFVGGIAGRLEDGALLDNCTNGSDTDAAAGAITYRTTSGKIESFSIVGGIAGGTAPVLSSAWASSPRAVLSGCSNFAPVRFGYQTVATASGTSYQTPFVGGVTGFVEGSLENCSNKGSVEADFFLAPLNNNGSGGFSRGLFLGGVAGIVTLNMTGCTNEGAVDMSGTLAGGTTFLTGSPCLGGVAALSGKSSSCQLTSCTNKGTVTAVYHMRGGNGTGAYAGGVVGYTAAAPVSCTNEGRLHIDSYFAVSSIGGIAGTFYPDADNITMTGCRNKADIEVTLPASPVGKQGNALRLGGLVGWQQSKTVNIAASSHAGKISLSGGGAGDAKYIGGIVGQMTASKLGGTASAKLTVSGGIELSGVKATTLAVGGAVGYHTTGRVDYTENSGAITLSSIACTNLYTGGVTGNSSSGVVGNCANSGTLTVSGTAGTQARIGGIRGQANGWIQNSTFSGNIDAHVETPYLYVGGVVGYFGATVISGCSSQGDLAAAAGGGLAAVGIVSGTQVCNAVYTGTYGGKLSASGGTQYSGFASGRLAVSNAADAPGTRIYLGGGRTAFNAADTTDYGTFVLASSAMAGDKTVPSQTWDTGSDAAWQAVMVGSNECGGAVQQKLEVR